MRNELGKASIRCSRVRADAFDEALRILRPLRMTNNRGKLRTEDAEMSCGKGSRDKRRRPAEETLPSEGQEEIANKPQPSKSLYLVPNLFARPNERTNERTDQRTKERTNERTKQASKQATSKCLS